MSGRIVAKNLKTLITGRGSKLATALSKHLVNNGATIYTLDSRMPHDLMSNKENIGKSTEHFAQGNVAEQAFFSEYLRKIGPIDTFVNCAAVRKSYNYFLSYLLSKSLLEKLQENEINEFGCRGCIVNLVHLSSQYDDKYFREQDEFAEKYNIDTAKIDDEVFQLADQLTAARIRCNTIMVNEKSDSRVFAKLVQHIIEDQYVAGQIINMEDDLNYKTRSFEDVARHAHNYPKPKVAEQPYVPPKEIEAKKGLLGKKASSASVPSLPDN